MRTKTAIIFKLPGDIEMEYKDNADKNFDIMFDTMRAVIADRSAEIVHNAPFSLEENRGSIIAPRKFKTFAMFRYWGPPYEIGSDEFWEAMDKLAKQANFPELIEKTYTYQLVELAYFDPGEFVFANGKIEINI